MPDPKRCENCLEPLCTFDEPGHADSSPHHGAKSFFTGEIITTHANERCTRPPVVEVKGCRWCLKRWVDTSVFPDQHWCRLDNYGDGQLKRLWSPMLDGPLPSWCPLLANKAGLTLRAVLPAEEKEG